MVQCGHLFVAANEIHTLVLVNSIYTTHYITISTRKSGVMDTNHRNLKHIKYIYIMEFFIFSIWYKRAICNGLNTDGRDVF